MKKAQVEKPGGIKPLRDVVVEIRVLNGRNGSGLALFTDGKQRVPGKRTAETLEDLLDAVHAATRKLSADQVRVRPGDRLKWRCRQADFTIGFGEQSPFVGGEVTLSSDRKETAPLTIKPLEAPGRKERYYYGILVVLGRRILTLDPEVIIEDGW